MSYKEEYKRLCKRKTDIPLFSKPEWFDLFNTNWDVISWEEDGNRCFFPFPWESKLGFRIIRNMSLTPYLQIIHDGDQDNKTKIKLEELINLMPKSSEYYLDFHPECNWELNNENIYLKRKKTNYIVFNHQDLFLTYKPTLQRQIRKANKNLILQETTHIEDFHRIYSLSLNQRKVFNPVDLNQMKIIWEKVYQWKMGRLLLAKDIEGNVHAGLFYVWDHSTMYYLLGGTDKTFNGSGAMGMLLHQAITTAQVMGLKKFDFEGSMEQGVDRFFKTFQPTEIIYYSFQKKTSSLLGLARKIKKITTL